MVQVPYMYWFFAGLFVAGALSQSLLFTILIGLILIVVWGDYVLPILIALLLDTALVSTREFANLYGFVFVSGAFVASAALLPLRKFLKF